MTLPLLEKLSDPANIDELLTHYRYLDSEHPVRKTKAILEDEANLFLTWIPSIGKQLEFVGKLEDMIEPIAKWSGAPVKWGAGTLLTELESFQENATSLSTTMSTRATNMREDAKKIDSSIAAIREALNDRLEDLKWLDSEVTSAGGAGQFVKQLLEERDIEDASDELKETYQRLVNMDDMWDRACGSGSAGRTVRYIYEHNERTAELCTVQEKDVLDAAASFAKVSSELQDHVEVTFKSFVTFVSEVAAARRSDAVKNVKAVAQVAKIVCDSAEVAIAVAVVPVHGVPLIGTAVAETLDKASGWTAFAVSTLGTLTKDLAVATKVVLSYASGTAGEKLAEMEAFDLLETELEVLDDVVGTTLSAVANAIPNPASTIMKIVKDPIKSLLAAPFKAAIIKGKAKWEEEQDPNKKRESFATEVKDSVNEELEPEVVAEGITKVVELACKSQTPEFGSFELGSGVGSIAGVITTFLIDAVVPPLLAKIIPACLTPNGLSGLQAQQILVDAAELPRRMAEAEPKAYKAIADALGLSSTPYKKEEPQGYVFDSAQVEAVRAGNKEGVVEVAGQVAALANADKSKDRKDSRVRGEWMCRWSTTGEGTESNPELVLLIGGPAITDVHNFAQRDFVQGIGEKDKSGFSTAEGVFEARFLPGGRVQYAFAGLPNDLYLKAQIEFWNALTSLNGADRIFEMKAG